PGFRLHGEMDLRLLHSGAQGGQRRGEAQLSSRSAALRFVLPEGGDDLADLAEQTLGQLLRGEDPLPGQIIWRVERSFQMKGEGGQMMAEDVMQLAGDAQPFGGAGAFGEQAAGGEERLV